MQSVKVRSERKLDKQIKSQWFVGIASFFLIKILDYSAIRDRQKVDYRPDCSKIFSVAYETGVDDPKKATEAF